MDSLKCNNNSSSNRDNNHNRDKDNNFHLDSMILVVLEEDLVPLDQDLEVDLEIHLAKIHFQLSEVVSVQDLTISPRLE